eukprot:6048982-Prymnesium_polylepis.1
MPSVLSSISRSAWYTPTLGAQDEWDSYAAAAVPNMDNRARPVAPLSRAAPQSAADGCCPPSRTSAASAPIATAPTSRTSHRHHCTAPTTPRTPAPGR